LVEEIYRIYDFSWVLGWRATWSEDERINMYRADSSVPTLSRTAREKNVAIELQTTDPQQPLISIPMSSRRAAETWSARLNAMFNG